MSVVEVVVYLGEGGCMGGRKTGRRGGDIGGAWGQLFGDPCDG